MKGKVQSCHSYTNDMSILCHILTRMFQTHGGEYLVVFTQLKSGYMDHLRPTDVIHV